MARRFVVIVAYDGMQPLDAIGPHEVFAGATSVLAARGRATDGYELDGYRRRFRSRSTTDVRRLHAAS